MKTVILAYGPLYLPVDKQIDGQFVVSYDPDATADGRVTGEAKFSHDIEDAIKFDTVQEAEAFAMQVSKTRPLRADGHPNRPLRAFTLEFMMIGGER
ncbi:MAG: hypothetical protein V4773_16650 [Verrucomicrobiota bacterium]